MFSNFKELLNIKIATNTTRFSEREVKVIVLNHANCHAETYIEIQYLLVNVSLSRVTEFHGSSANFLPILARLIQNYSNKSVNKVDGLSLGVPLQSSASFAKNSISHSHSEPPR